MKKLLYIGFAALCLGACNNKPAGDGSTASTNADSSGRTVSADSTAMSSKPSNTADSVFLVTADQVGAFEIAAAALAQTNSKDAQVRAFATKMTTDHTSMNKDAESLAAQKNISLPAGPGDDLQKELDKLGGLNGKPFDREYADVNVKGHKDAIAAFQAASQNKDCSPEVQQLATNALPTLKKHKEHADMLKVHVMM